VSVCINTKLTFKSPFQVGTSDMSLNKGSKSGDNGGSGVCSYEVLRS
jgi:hypothetical protein